MLKEFPNLLKPQEAASDSTTKAKSPAKVRSLLQSPLEFYELFEGPNKDPTFIVALPTEALRLWMKHIQDLYAHVYLTEIKGALTGQTVWKWTWDKFLECERPKKRFGEPFRIAYQKIAPPPAAPGSQEKDEGADDTETKQKGEDKAAASATPKDLRLFEFRKDCEAYVDRELAARLVILTNDGTHEELQNALTGTRLYQNLSTAGARFMGFYDVKNAMLCEVYEGEALTQREPVLDEEHFKNFLKVMDGIMKHSEDVCWIMCGRAEHNYEKIKKEVSAIGWKSKVFSLIYSTKLLQKWYWKRRRGIANSRNLEKVIFAWKGKLPGGLPKERRYVDEGSRLYNEVVLKVPVVGKKKTHFAYLFTSRFIHFT